MRIPPIWEFVLVEYRLAGSAVAAAGYCVAQRSWDSYWVGTDQRRQGDGPSEALLGPRSSQLGLEQIRCCLGRSEFDKPLDAVEGCFRVIYAIGQRTRGSEI